MRNTLRFALAAFAAATLGACADTGTPTAPSTATPRTAAVARGGDRLATIEWEGSTPALYIQNADGTNRKRVHFDHVTGHVTGNYSFQVLPVTDESITRFVRVKWSPDGRYLAVMLAPATSALQIVLVTADGLALRTVSPNSQYLWGDMDWSADGRKLAYIMATGPYGLAPDLFMTEIGSDNVTRLTTGARVSGYDVVRFDPTGSKVWFTERLGWAQDGMNGLARLASVDLATGAVERGAEVVGEPQALSRDGSWGVFARFGGRGTRELFRRASTGGEVVLASDPNLGGATMLENETEAVVTFWGDLGQTFTLQGLSTLNDLHAKLPLVSSTTWASMWRTP